MKIATLAGIIFLTILAFFHFRKGPLLENQPAPKIERVVTPAPPRTPTLGDTMLADYASEETSGKEDLEIFARFLDSVFLLVKSRDTSEYATNKDLVLFLQGSNSHQSSFLNSDSPHLNQEGEIIDRWDSPIIVHPVSSKLLELRSAGPDETPYTADDFLWPRD